MPTHADAHHLCCCSLTPAASATPCSTTCNIIQRIDQVRTIGTQPSIAHLYHIPTPTTRRAALSLGAAAIVSGTPLITPPAHAATEAFCGVLDYVPSWAFSLPWTETITTLPNNNQVWIRKVGQEPTSGFLGIGKKGAAEYVIGVVVVDVPWMDNRCVHDLCEYLSMHPTSTHTNTNTYPNTYNKNTVQIQKLTPHTHTNTHSKLPLLVVHGGPGLSSRYLESLEILCAADRRVSFYDQVGGCRWMHVVASGCSDG